MIQVNLFAKQKQTDVENKPMDIKGGGGQDGLGDWD